MTKLFQNFKKYDINDWKENIIEEFGNETFLNLHKKIEEIDISPIYHNNKTSFNPNFPDEIINIQKIDATNAKKANKIALTALNSGANGLCFSSPNNLDI